LHGKLDLANTKGLKKSELKKLNRLLQERIPEDRVLTLDLAESLAEISYEIGSTISAVVNRRGQIVNITVGRPTEVNVPEMKGARVGPGRLSGHRVIYTHLASKSGKTGPNKDDLQSLLRNRLDALALIEVDPEGKFSRSRGEQAQYADAVYVAHVLPSRDVDGKLWKLSDGMTARKAQEEDFAKLIQSLEDEFRRVAPKFQPADGEERAILAALITEGMDAWQVEDDLDELAQLVKTAGATVCGRMTQARLAPDPRVFLGSGKVQELSLMVQEYGANLVVVDHELTPNQQRNLEEAVGVKVIDRTELILDIFAQRAQTKEGKLQVELAQLKYLYPRLIGKGLTLSRLGGGGTGGGIATRGPGETKLEIDRRRIRDRINLLERETSRIRMNRDTQRRKRIFENMPVLALTGYTNSGKSTLLNALTKSDSLVDHRHRRIHQEIAFVPRRRLRRHAGRGDRRRCADPRRRRITPERDGAHYLGARHSRGIERHRQTDDHGSEQSRQGSFRRPRMARISASESSHRLRP
jgi:GTPase